MFITKKTVLSVCLGLCLSVFAHADTGHHHEPTSDELANTALPELDSINQLGELKFTVPTMHRFDTDIGVPVVFTPLDGLPIVDIRLEFLAGSGHDTMIRSDGFGIASMVATMLTQGTDSLTEDDFIAQSERLGIQLSASAGKDSLSIDLRSLSNPQTLVPAVELMIDAMTHTKFDKDVLSRNKDRLITSIRQREQTPNYVASIALGQALFGTHPYAHPVIGTKESVATLSTADLHAFKQQFLTAKNARLTITGNLSKQEAHRLANTITSQLPIGEHSQALPIPTIPNPKHIHINHPSTQTVVLLANLTKPFASDALSLQETTNLNIANEVLAGGDFSARLMDEIRVKKGYTYGIYGRNQAMTATGFYAISFSTQGEKAKDAIIDTLNLIKSTQKTGISQGELNLAIFNDRNSYPNAFASNAGIHQIASYINAYHLPEDYLSAYTQRLDRVTLANANQALKDNIHPEQFVIITVGATKPDLTELESQ